MGAAKIWAATSSLKWAAAVITFTIAAAIMFEQQPSRSVNRAAAIQNAQMQEQHQFIFNSRKLITKTSKGSNHVKALSAFSAAMFKKGQPSRYIKRSVVGRGEAEKFGWERRGEFGCSLLVLGKVLLLGFCVVYVLVWVYRVLRGDTVLGGCSG
ncbi:hypothetical protein ACLOJK_037347, partial [Asimina triloba]